DAPRVICRWRESRAPLARVCRRVARVTRGLRGHFRGRLVKWGWGGGMASTRSVRGLRAGRLRGFGLGIRAAGLRKNGVKIRLQEQPFRILVMLLEHPGEVVLRDEIRRRLWPNDTVVEVSHGINAAVLRLREALGDSAENPQYVETLARRGYRFV